MLHLYRSAPIRYRVATGAFILGALLVVIVVQATVQVSERGLREQFDERAETLLNVVVAMSQEPLLTGEHSRNNGVLQQMDAEEIGTIDVVNIVGQIVSSTDPERVGLDIASADSLLHHHGVGPVRERKVTGPPGELGTVRISLDTTAVDGLLQEERRRGLVAGIVGVSAVALISMLGGWGLTRGLTDLESQLDNTDDDGLPYPVRIKGNDEIGRLGAALNHRTNRIREGVDANTTARETLRITEVKLQLALATAADVVVELDTESFEFTMIGSTATGSRMREMAGADTRPLMERVHPDDQPVVASTIGRVLSGPLGPTGATKINVRVRSNSGSWTNLVVRVQAIAGPIGSKPRILMAMVDVTEQRLTEHRLAQADKMRAIGRLTSGIAHDFNNTLAVSRLQLSVLRRADRDRSKDAERIEQLCLANDNATAMVAGLLRSAAPQSVRPASPTMTDVEKLVASLSGVLNTILGADIELRLDLTTDHAAVIIDEAAIQQVIMNLARNAADAMNGAGHVSIRTWNPDSTSVNIQVTDDGPGIDPSIADSLFEPFVTTKPLGAGTGLGLATTYDTVTAAGGSIYASRSDEGGAAFTLTLPLASMDRPEPRIETGGHRPHIDAPKRILLVEDNDALLQGLVVLLEDEGYEVTPAVSVGDALRQAAQSDVFGLLFTDVGLPDGSGFELRDQLAQRAPGIVTLYMSAFLPDSPAAPGAGTSFLQKPFDDAEMLSNVAAAFAQPSMTT